MIQRNYKLSKLRSFFLLGPRGVGKSTLLREHFREINCFYVNLLESDVERRLAARPERLLEEWNAQPKAIQESKWIVIDEVQRVPRILDAVHKGIADFGLRFALTGSSARKLKRGAANLLAGRASEFRMHPFSFTELGHDFDPIDAMTFGLLPESFQLKDNLLERRRFLNSYVNTYLREEIQAEQIVRNMEPFRQFIEVAAATNGKILNAAKVGRQCGLDPKTSQRYFQILSDTLVGFYLPAFDLSIRKQQATHPKFFWFDLGVARAASGMLDEKISASTYEFGNLFEHLVIGEASKLNDQSEAGAKLMYFRSADGSEIDLVVKRGKSLYAIEIKSAENPDITDIRKLSRLQQSLPKGTQAFVFCNTVKPYVSEGVRIVHWMAGLQEIFPWQ